jgi:hypothetical protein
MQNRSHAVMSQRVESPESLDDFPTPPWATRALLEHIISESTNRSHTCLEPACNRGFMAEPLKEYFKEVTASDIHDYGYGDLSDFLSHDYEPESFDWVITNPPFKSAEEFVQEGLRVARIGVAMLARTVFLESVGRYERLFSLRPPSVFAQFTERVPMFKGRIDPTGSTATGYAWFVWIKGDSNAPRLAWIPPCRKKLERHADYQEIAAGDGARVRVKTNLFD